MNNEDAPLMAVEYLLRPSTIRMRCGKLTTEARAGRSEYFAVDDQNMDNVVDYVIDVTKENYPDLDVPYHSRWRHFEFEQHNFLTDLPLPETQPERGRCVTELAIVSVLLDAGAGPQWRYRDRDFSQIEVGRSEGLALASLRMYADGLFSNQKHDSLAVDSGKLKTLDEKALAHAFQHDATTNPLTGLAGRVELLRALGRTIASQPKYFGNDARLGNLFDYFCNLGQAQTISATEILRTILYALGSIWPGRFAIGEYNLGDVWHHPAVATSDLTNGLVPFHKLSQWLTYSLLEPLEEAGYQISDIDGLTGLPEYRNGGLFIDLGVLKPKQSYLLTRKQPVDSKAVIEWRALTVSLLDELGPLVCKRLLKTPLEFPLAKVLQGGTWSAGRKIAVEIRAGGEPPIQIESDGTVF